MSQYNKCIAVLYLDTVIDVTILVQRLSHCYKSIYV